MNLNAIGRRIEITFWKITVKLMEEPKKLLVLLLCLALVLSLGFGWLITSIIQTANLNREINRTQPAPVYIGAQQDARLQRATSEPVSQRKILVILVDQLEVAEPQLVSIWFTTYVQARNLASLIPLYPASLSGGAADDHQLAKAFRLSAAGEPERSFLELMRAKDLAWDNFILLDQTALAELLELSGRLQPGTGKVDAVQILAQIPQSTREPQAALVAHAQLAQNLCLGSAELVQAVEAQELLERLSLHLRTDLPEKYLADEWQTLRLARSDISCEFPTLTESFSKP